MTTRRELITLLGSATRARAERAAADAVDEDGILKDGRSLVVPMFMADGSINPKLTFEQRLVAEKAQQALRDKATTKKEAPMKHPYTMADAQRFGLQDASALSRPGFRYNGADPYARDAAIIAHKDYDVDAESAWKGEKARNPDEEGAEDPRAGGYLKAAADKSPVSTNADSLSARDAARIAYEDELTNAWRHPVGSAPVVDSVVPAAPQRIDPTKDAATVSKEHQARMGEIYAARDAEMSEAWRR
jgi:hypothetical protein